MTVHNLQTQSGILDPDDQVNDVADDKEQILACFEDDPGVPQGGGDGASGSSVGTGSPDIFRVSFFRQLHFTLQLTERTLLSYTGTRTKIRTRKPYASY